MVIIEVAMPSGFLVEKDRLAELLKKPHVKLVETKRGETVADIYIDQMLPNEDICLEVQGYRSHKVAENKPVPVRIYDYYDSCKYSSFFQKYLHFHAEAMKNVFNHLYGLFACYFRYSSKRS